MKVKDLRNYIMDLDDNDIVVMAADEEGNYYNKLRVICEATYADGEVYPRELTDEDRANGYDEDDLNPDAIPAIVLYP